MTAATAQPMALPSFTPAARWLATAAVLSAFFTSILTGNMVNVAIPAVMGTFGVGQGQAQLLSSTFLAMNTTGLLASSWLLAKIGQRATFYGVMTAFAGGALICYASPVLEVVIAGRMIQGAAAGVLQPLVMLVLFQVFPMERRGLAMGLFSMGVTVALGLGPVIGGITIDEMSWRAIFLIPIPACFLAILLGMLFLPPEPQRGHSGSFDVLGFALINAAVFCWFMLLGNGQRWGWESDDALALAATTVACGFAFVISQKRRSATLLDLGLFSNRRFVTALSISFLFGFSNFANVYAFPIFGQIVQSFTPTVAGSMLLPGSIVAALVLPIAGRFADRAPAPLLLALGHIIVAGSIVMLAGADANTVFWYVAISLLIGRVGSALVSPALNTTAVGALSPDQFRRGAGVVNLALMLGGSTGISMFVLLLERRVEFHATSLGATQTAANASTTEMLGMVTGRLATAGLPEVAQTGLAYDYLDRMITAQANMLGFQDSFLAITVISLVPLIPVMMLWRGGRRT